MKSLYTDKNTYTEEAKDIWHEIEKALTLNISLIDLLESDLEFEQIRNNKQFKVFLNKFKSTNN